MKLPINVLLLDDEIDFLQDFEQSAKSHRVIIENHFTNAKEGIQYIKENHNKIDAVILDGFFLSDEEASKIKSKKALSQTISTLKKLFHTEGIHIPHCILTGYLEDLKDDSISLDTKIFHKGEDDEKLFEYLKNQVKKSEDYKIKNTYSDVFKVFDNGYMPQDKEPDLIQILKKMESKAKYNKDGAFNPLRKMYEAFVKCFHDEAFETDKDQDFVHRKIFSGPNHEHVNIKGSWFYFSGMEVKRNGKTFIKERSEPVFPEHIKNLTSGFVDLIQTESHDYPEEVTHYAYKSAVFALLELLVWYNNFCNQNFNN